MHKKRAQNNAIKHLKPKTPRQATARPSPIRVSSSTYITSVSNGCPPPHPPTLPTKSAPHIVKAGPRSNRRMIGTPPPSAPHPRARPCPPRACRRPQGRPREVGWAREGGVAHEKPALEALHPRLGPVYMCMCRSFLRNKKRSLNHFTPPQLPHTLPPKLPTNYTRDPHTNQRGRTPRHTQTAYRRGAARCT